MSSEGSRWRWVEGKVDRAGDHLMISYGDEYQPIAVIGPPSDKVFSVKFLLEDVPGQLKSAVEQELDFYLVHKGEDDPWSYAQYHCTTSANIYSSFHWGYYPRGAVKD